MSEYPQLVTAKQAANMLQISKSKLYLLLKSGELGSVHIGRCRRITKNQVLDYVRSLNA